MVKNYKRGRTTRRRVGAVRRPAKKVTKANRKTGSQFRKLGIPKILVANMRYCQTVSLNPSLATPLASQIFRCNNIYDPDQSGTGHQPYLHDWYQQIYNHYQVLKARIKCEFIAGASTQSQSNCTIGIAVSDDTTVETDLNAVREQRGAKMKLLAQDQTKVVTHGYNGYKMYGRDNMSKTRALFGAAPEEEAYWHVFVMPTDLAVDLGAVQVQVTIDYTVRMTELKAYGPS